MNSTREEIRAAILRGQGAGAAKSSCWGRAVDLSHAGADPLHASNGLVVRMFTNGSGRLGGFGRMLYAPNVRVVLKMNSFDEACKTGSRPSEAFASSTALSRLKAAGYRSEDHFLGGQLDHLPPEHAELPRLWQGCANNASSSF
jgi:hypothetical protein